MKASELRVGNYINFNVDNNPATVIQILVGGISVNNHTLEECSQAWGEWLVAEDQIKPIPLTEEWLLKFGFEKRIVPGSNGLFDFYNNILLEYSFEISCFWLSNCYQNDHEILIQTQPLKYVHQLQNLYFCLTGKELEISE